MTLLAYTVYLVALFVAVVVLFQQPKDNVLKKFLVICFVYLLYFHIYLHMHAAVPTEVRGQLRRVLSFHYEGSRDRTKVIRVGSRHLDPLNHAASPLGSFFPLCAFLILHKQLFGLKFSIVHHIKYLAHYYV